MKKIQESLQSINKILTYPDIHIIEGCSTDPEVIINNKRILMFASNNYLGLANDQMIKKKAAEALQKYGVGSGGSRLVSGNLDIHIELEKKIAEFKKTEAAIIFATGYMTNIGVIPVIVNPLNPSKMHYIKSKLFFSQTIIFSDELNHASIIDACRLAKTKIEIFKHRDMDDLEEKLGNYRRQRKLIVTDGVFSMDGDIAPLPQIVELAKKYNAITMVDDAHGMGVLGEHGGGSTEHFHVDDKIDIIMGTFTKSVGAVGGFIAGKKYLIDYLRVTSRTNMFSAPIPPAICAAIIEALNEISGNQERRKRVSRNAEYLKSKLQKEGFDVLESESAIIPILIGKEDTAIKFARKLFAEKVFAPCIRWPAVAKGKSRLRLTVMATHTKEQLNYLIDTMTHVGKELAII